MTLTNERLDELFRYAGAQHIDGDLCIANPLELRALIRLARLAQVRGEVIEKLEPEVQCHAEYHGHKWDGTGYYGSMFKSVRQAIDTDAAERGEA